MLLNQRFISYSRIQGYKDTKIQGYKDTKIHVSFLFLGVHA